MKRMIIVVALLCVFAVTSFAEGQRYSQQQLLKAEKNLMVALKSDNPGVRNSALHQITIIKASYPEFNMSVIERQVLKIAKNDNVMVVRVNANLTYRCINDTDLVKSANVQTMDPKEFFSDLYLQLAETGN